MLFQTVFSSLHHQPNDLSWDVAGTSLLLTATKVVVWPAERVLFVADVHVGKAASFRALGVPVPAGTTDATLARLSEQLKQHDIAHLVILGDFLHSAKGKTSAILDALQQWRSSWPTLKITLVDGNHDKSSGRLPDSLNIESVDEPYRMGPFAACHIPQQVEGAYVLAGHIHPAVRLSGKGADRTRLPCFWEQNHSVLTLPAFGDFTGMFTIEPAPGDQVVCVVTDV